MSGCLSYALNAFLRRRRAECKEEEQAAKGHEKKSKSQEAQIEGRPKQQEEKSLLGKSGLVESFLWHFFFKT